MKYIDADHLRAEIEKERKKALDSTKRGGLTISDIATADVLAEVLLIIEQLKKEQPMDGLEDELKDYLRRYYNCDYPMQIEENTCSPTMPHIVEAASHFAQWGAEHLADARKTSPKDLEEAAEKYVSTLCDRADEGLRIDTTLESAFIAGAKWQKEQMMKEAVEGVFQNTPFPTICLDDCKDYDFKEGDKVKLIICKED